MYWKECSQKCHFLPLSSSPKLAVAEEWAPMDSLIGLERALTDNLSRNLMPGLLLDNCLCPGRESLKNTSKYLSTHKFFTQFIHRITIPGISTTKKYKLNNYPPIFSLTFSHILARTTFFFFSVKLTGISRSIFSLVRCCLDPTEL